LSTSPTTIIPRLEISDASLERGGRLLFARLSFSLGMGEALLVTGPNGAGKSSLLRAIAGFLPLGSGQVTFHGENEDLPAGMRAHYLGHADALKNALTSAENLDFWAAMLGAPVTGPRAETALARLALSHVADLPVAYLSAGQRRRVAFARLLLVERPLWLLDEPTTALDAAAQDRLAEIMHDHLERGGMLIAATHAPLGLVGARELRLGQPA
jgi:heme exporter protein A